MSNEKYNQIIDDAYKNYLHKVIRDKDIVRYLKSHSIDTNGVPTIELYSKEEFINKIKTDDEFVKKWGLKIDERELSLEERYNIWFNNNYETGMERYFNKNNLPNFEDGYYTVTPTRLITMTYKNETIEIYE